MEILKGGLNVSDEILGNFAPIIVYWMYSGTYVMLGSVQSYRSHTKKEESEKNLVPKTDVFKRVLLQQAVQAVVATMLFVHLKRFNHPRVPSSYWKRNFAQPQPASFIVLARQFFVAMVVLDTSQYFMHRYMHHNKFLYRQSTLSITGLLSHTPLELYTTTPCIFS